MMTTPPVPSQPSGPLEHRRRSWLSGWWHTRPEALPAFDQDRIPTVEQTLEQDAHTRWIILVCLDGATQVSLRFIELMTPCASAEERQRSLDWLVTTGCITEHRHADRTCFWQQRREWYSYGITPLGSALLARIHATATAEQLGIQGESPDLPKLVSPRWWRVAYGVFTVVLVALAAAITVPLLVQVFTR